MMANDRLDEFIRIVVEEYGVRLSREQALARMYQTLAMYEAVYDRIKGVPPSPLHRTGEARDQYGS